MHARAILVPLAAAALFSACAANRPATFGAYDALRPRATVGAQVTTVRVERPAYVNLVALDGRYASHIHDGNAQRLEAGRHALNVRALANRATAAAAATPATPPCTPRPLPAAQVGSTGSQPATIVSSAVPVCSAPARPESPRTPRARDPLHVIVLASDHPLPKDEVNALLLKFNERPERADPVAEATELVRLLSLAAAPGEWAASVVEVP